LLGAEVAVRGWLEAVLGAVLGAEVVSRAGFATLVGELLLLGAEVAERL